MNKLLNNKGFSLIELLIAIGMFGVVSVTLIFFSIDAARFNSVSEKNIIAAQKLRELSNAILLNKNDIWSNIVSNTDNGSKSLVFTNNKYTFDDGPEVFDDFSIDIFINSLNRQSDFTITTIGGVFDPQTREVEIVVSWVDPITGSQSITSNFYINNWNTPRWYQTLETDFSIGTLDSTIVTSRGDGAVEMDISSDINGDWCEPSLTLTEFDLPGQGVANAITAVEGKISLGTGENASGLAYIDVNATTVDPPVATVNGTFDSSDKTNDVFGELDYAYLGTDTNNSEVIILDTSGSGTNPVQSGYYDAVGNQNADAIYVDGNYGYVGVGSQVQIFDLSSKIGSRPQVGTALTMNGTVKDLEVHNGYAYVITTNTTTQVQIVDVSVPTSLSVVATVSLNGAAGVDLYVFEEIDRLYIVTASSTTQNEFFIVDISTISGSLPVVSSYNISDGLNPRGLSVPVDNRAIIVGENGTNQYQVLDIVNELSPTYCGGLQISTGVKGIDSLLASNGNAWSYVSTGDSSAELKIIQGGPGGGGGNGQGSGFPDEGTFESTVFDTNSITTNYYSIAWGETLLPNTDVSFQVRAGTSFDLSGENWVGPDGTSSTYFTNSLGETLPSIVDGKRYIQYKGYFSSPLRINTPILEEVKIYYDR